MKGGVFFKSSTSCILAFAFVLRGLEDESFLNLYINELEKEET